MHVLSLSKVNSKVNQLSIFRLNMKMPVNEKLGGLTSLLTIGHIGRNIAAN